MEYMLLIQVDPATSPSADPTTPEGQALMQAWLAYNQRLIDGGHWVAGASLHAPTTATVVRVAARTPSVTDGPFAETKEQVGGFYLVEAADLDQALELAAAMPLPDYAVEVRPIMFRPDAARADG